MGSIGIAGTRVRGAAGLVIAAVLAGAAVGCADEEPRAPVTASGGAAAEQRQPKESDDGTLTASDGRVIRDWGDEADRKLVVARFARMQRDFRAGRMGAVCAHVAELGLAQFTPGGTSADTPCPAKLRAYASELRRQGARPVRSRLLWARAYPIVASVWVEDPRGTRVRVGFTDIDGSGMKLEVGTSSRRELLYGTLAGARRYSAR